MHEGSRVSSLEVPVFEREVSKKTPAYNRLMHTNFHDEGERF